MAINMRTLANHYYSLGQDTHRTKQSSYAGLGSAGLAASRLSPVGLRNLAAGAGYRVSGGLAGALAGQAGGFDSLGFMGGGLIGMMGGKLVHDANTLHMARKLTQSEAKQVLKEIPHYGAEMVTSSLNPIGSLAKTVLLGGNPLLGGAYATSNLLTDLLVRKRLLQQAGRL